MLGTLAASGCDNIGRTHEFVQQAQYTSRDDCIADWGRDERDCQPANSSSAAAGGGHGSRTVYLGPRYYWDRSLGWPVVVDADGSTRSASRSGRVAQGASPQNAHMIYSNAAVQRGGFGSHGRAGGGSSGG